MPSRPARDTRGGRVRPLDGWRRAGCRCQRGRIAPAQRTVDERVPVMRPAQLASFHGPRGRHARRWRRGPRRLPVTLTPSAAPSPSTRRSAMICGSGTSTSCGPRPAQRVGHATRHGDVHYAPHVGLDTWTACHARALTPKWYVALSPRAVCAMIECDKRRSPRGIDARVPEMRLAAHHLSVPVRLGEQRLTLRRRRSASEGVLA